MTTDLQNGEYFTYLTEWTTILQMMYILLIVIETGVMIFKLTKQKEKNEQADGINNKQEKKKRKKLKRGSSGLSLDLSSVEDNEIILAPEEGNKFEYDFGSKTKSGNYEKFLWIFWQIVAVYSFLVVIFFYSVRQQRESNEKLRFIDVSLQGLNIIPTIIEIFLNRMRLPILHLVFIILFSFLYFLIYIIYFFVSDKPAYEEINPKTKSGWIWIVVIILVSIAFFLVVKLIALARDKIWANCDNDSIHDKKDYQPKQNAKHSSKDEEDEPLHNTTIDNKDKEFHIIMGDGNDKDLQETSSSDKFKDYQSSEIGSSELDNPFHSTSERD
ncbi:hypothetical protein M0813_04735 [Anaeramoeba flamelloides]|uniref:Transmembrane protein n=1 Tax=Anaeramoeba flamelloides TaxID=1746091 RepID=A0ABQ8XK93_9EUKA|nr:hypothetical protein M0813_04735 [Anaeramoeba flamelloides]